MRASIHHLIAIIRSPKAIAGLLLATMLSILAIDTFGYLIWRRFPVPLLLLLIASIWKRVARKVNELELSRISANVNTFAIVLLAGAFLDGYFFPAKGYITFLAFVVLFAWIAFESEIADKLLARMRPQEQRELTQNVHVILAKMQAVSEQNAVVIKDTEPFLKESKLQLGL